MSSVRAFAVIATLLVLVAMYVPGPVAACGGFFCTTVPVDQAAERVIFTMDPGSITTYVQINYVGAAEDFAWVLPVPAVPRIDTAEMSTFRDLDRLTQPIYIAPRPPDCLRNRMPMPSAAPASARPGGVTVEASGEIGPFGYHVVSSPDPNEMVRWLRENGYRITPEMEPLIKLYTDDGLMFLAMKLKQGQNARDIVPVKLTYESTLPMIPLRLTAVAATPDMPVLVWVFASAQTAPTNFASIRIADSEVAFTPFGQNDYQQVVTRAIDQVGGRGFVTELAQPTSALRPPTDETLKLLVQQYPYLTRLYTRISPEEMTVDPIFDLAPERADISNIHDLSDRPPPWTCSDDVSTWRTVGSSGPPPWLMAAGRYFQRLGEGGGPKGAALLVALAATALFLVRRRPGKVSAIDGTSVRRRLAAYASRFDLSPRATALLFLEAVALQGFHEIEHIVQLIQRLALGISTGAGILGSAFDIEPVHMIYNAAFLLLLAAIYLGCRRNGPPIQAHASAVVGLLGIGLAAQGYHTIEHVVKMWQYLQWGVNGTPGILGYWVPVVYLHFWLNTIIYAPVVAAFFLGGYHLAAREALRPLWPRRAPRPRTAA